MPSNMIEEAYHRAKETSIKGIRCIETIVKNWSENKIYTVEDLEEHLSQKSKKSEIYIEILKKLEFDKQFNNEEKRIIDSWIDDFKFSMEMILYACYNTRKVDKRSIAYINGILRNWHKDGFKSVEDVQNNRVNHIKKNNERKKHNKNNYDHYSIILTKIGFNRQATGEEKEIIDSWFKNYELTLDQILIFCKIIKKQHQPISIQLMNEIIENTIGDNKKTLVLTFI